MNELFVNGCFILFIVCILVSLFLNAVIIFRIFIMNTWALR